MNKNHQSSEGIQAVEDSTNRFYEGAAFSALHFDGAGQQAGISAALTILERAQTRCTDYQMQTDEVQQACDYLSRNDKVRPVTKRFWDGLIVPNQHARFEATSQALRVIRQQFGA